MPNTVKTKFLFKLKEKFGVVKKLPNSQSLYEIGDSLSRIYIRYSKIHSRNQAFYGIRKEDLKELDGFNSFICFLYENQMEPIFVPYDEFEDIFNSLTPSSDGQIKSSIFIQEDGMELYIANSGRFNVEGYLGWNYFLDKINISKIESPPELTHSQIQTFIGSIGLIKGYEIWIPPIYSGLLRFNDLHLIEPSLKSKYSIVSNDIRRSLFFRQINRPTFKASGLTDYCSFLDYKDVYSWYNRISKEKQ